MSTPCPQHPNAIVVLRAFREPDAIPNRHQLIEIPADLFEALEDAPESAFAADGPVIDCACRGLPSAAQVAIDRSDAKVTAPEAPEARGQPVQLK